MGSPSLHRLLAPIQPQPHPNRLPRRTLPFCVDWKTENSYGEYYARSAPVYSAIKLRQDAVAGVPLQVCGPEGRPVEPGHPARRLLDRPNPFWTHGDLWRATETYLGLWGSAYWGLERDDRGQPFEMWPLRPDRVRVVPDPDQYIKGFVYVGRGRELVPYAPDDVVWLRYFNPLDEYAGLSPVAPLRLSIDMGLDALQASRNSLTNDSTPGIILESSDTPTDDEVREFYERWEARFKGPERVRRPVLHGNSNRNERTPDGGTDENVFDIRQGVAIGLYVKRSKGPDGPAKVFHADLWGTRSAKYTTLAVSDRTTTDWERIRPMSPRYMFKPWVGKRELEYDQWPKITEIAPVNSVGIVTGQDKVAIRWSANEMKQVARKLMSSLDEDIEEKRITSVLYRPFDTRYTYYSDHVITRRRHRVMRHMQAGPNVGLITCRQQSQVGVEWSLCGVSRQMIESCGISNKTPEINYLFPLYTYPTQEQENLDFAREPNLDQEFLKAVGASLGLEFVPDDSGDLRESFGPEDVLHYIYAVLHSPEYRRRYAAFLKSDFPRVPLTSDRSLFAGLAGLGKRLVSLHLMESDGEEAPAYPITGSNRVDKVRYAQPADPAPGRVFINRTQYFEGVTPETWRLTVGSYHPAEKWLKDRKGRTLSYDDIAHYPRVCAALAETPKVMASIDEAIESHGGWPLA